MTHTGSRYLNTVMKASAPTKTSERTSCRLYKTQSMLSFAKASDVGNTRNHNQESMMTHQGSEPKLLFIKKNKSKRKIININSKASKRQ